MKAVEEDIVKKMTLINNRIKSRIMRSIPIEINITFFHFNFETPLFLFKIKSLIE